MNAKAIVIGSGIVGPMAAITLATLGYDVTVYEARPESDLTSDGILGITPENTSAMQAAGIKLARFMLDNTFRTWPEKEVKHSSYTYITWTNLHRALTERATELGVVFRYATRYVEGMSPAADVTVIASGVGTAKAVSEPHYTGYVVIRGLAYQWAGTPWTTVYGDSNSGPWLFNVGDSDDGASVEFFVKRESVQMRTTYSAVAPAEVNDLPIRFRRLMETVPIWQIAPLSDWDVPAHMIDRANKVIRIGDANGQMRPQTSMGANLGINEAMNIADMIAGSDTDYVNARKAQFTRGQEIGIQRGKFSK